MPIQIAILDDHQAILDGYLYRLSGVPDLQVVATLMYGDEVEPTLERLAVDVLILDVSVPANPANLNPYPILYLIPHLLEIHPQLDVLVISMHSQRAMLRAVMEAGASGYILKDDRAAILELAAIVRLVHSGGIYLSRKMAGLLQPGPGEPENMLTPRQAEVLSCCAAYPDRSTAELAERMQIAQSTLRNLLSGAYLRLNVSTRAAAIARARSVGLIPQE